MKSYLGGPALRVLEPRRALRRDGGRRRPGHRVALGGGPRGGPGPRPQVLGQRCGLRPLHHEGGGGGGRGRRRGAERRGGGAGGPEHRLGRGRPALPTPQSRLHHLPLWLGRPGHAVLPVGPHRRRALPTPSPGPHAHPPRHAWHHAARCQRLAERGAGPRAPAPLAVPLQQPPAPRGQRQGGRPGHGGRARHALQHRPLRHAHAAGPGAEKEHKRYHSLGSISQGGSGAGAAGTSPAAPPPGAGWTPPRCWAPLFALASTRCRCWSR